MGYGETKRAGKSDSSDRLSCPNVNVGYPSIKNGEDGTVTASASGGSTRASSHFGLVFIGFEVTLGTDDAVVVDSLKGMASSV